MTTWSKKMLLLKGLLAGDKAYTGPFSATIDLARRCNLRCLGCRYHSTKIYMPALGDQSKLDLSVETFKRICNELREMGTNYLVLTGEGEPFLHSYLVEMISVAKKTGFIVELFTNGTLMDEEGLEGLIDVRLDRLRVSLWASSEDEYKINYPGTKSGTFTKIINSLQRLAQLKKEKDATLPFVSIHRPINHDNLQGVEDMMHIAHSTSSNKVSFSPFKSRRRELAQSSLSYDEEKHVKSILQQMKSLSLSSNIDQTLLRYDIGEAVWKKLPCYIGWINIRIKVDGTVLPCNACSIPIGSLNKKSLAEIWNGSAMRDFRRRTISREGLRKMSDDCDCGFCCHIIENLRIHRIFRWILPVRRSMDVNRLNSIK